MSNKKKKTNSSDLNNLYRAQFIDTSIPTTIYLQLN